MVRALLLVIYCSLLTACISSGGSASLRSSEGRNEARDAYIQLGIGYLQQGINEQAKVPLQKALDIDPHSADAHAALALVFQNEMEPELASKHFHKALAQGKNTRIQNNYGSFLYEQGDYKAAYEQFAKATEDTMYVGRSRVFESMGLTALRLEDEPLAMQHFERSLRLNSRQPRALLEMASLSYERREYVPAKQYYELFLQQSEHSARSLLLGVRLAKIFQDRDQAASLGLQLKRLYPASAEYTEYQSEQ